MTRSMFLLASLLFVFSLTGCLGGGSGGSSSSAESSSGENALANIGVVSRVELVSAVEDN